MGEQCWLVPPGMPAPPPLPSVCVSRQLPGSADRAGFEIACVVHSFAGGSFARPSIHWVLLNAYYVLGPVQTLGGVRMGKKPVVAAFLIPPRCALSIGPELFAHTVGSCPHSCLQSYFFSSLQMMQGKRLCSDSERSGL